MVRGPVARRGINVVDLEGSAVELDLDGLDLEQRVRGGQGGSVDRGEGD